MEKTGNRISFCGMSMRGKRRRQEDCWKCAQAADKTIAVVCDGMGGMEGGHIASRLAAELLLKDLAAADFSGGAAAFFKRELEYLDDAVYGLKSSAGTRIGAGTTLVSAVVGPEGLYWFSVGDSRLYYFRGQELYCVTRAHNYAFLVKEGQEENVRESNARASSGNPELPEKGEQLVSYLGMGTAELFDSNDIPFPVRRGDKLLLCTDGLYRTVEEREIAQILAETGGVTEGSRRLERAVLRRNKKHQDNATWILLNM